MSNSLTALVSLSMLQMLYVGGRFDRLLPSFSSPKDATVFDLLCSCSIWVAFSRYSFVGLWCPITPGTMWLSVQESLPSMSSWKLSSHFNPFFICRTMVNLSIIIYNAFDFSLNYHRHAFATLSFVAEVFIFVYVGMDALDIAKWRFVSGRYYQHKTRWLTSPFGSKLLPCWTLYLLVVVVFVILQKKCMI